MSFWQLQQEGQEHGLIHRLQSTKESSDSGAGGENKDRKLDDLILLRVGATAGLPREK